MGEPEEIPQLPMSLCGHIASRHGYRYGWFSADRFLPESAPSYGGSPKEVQRVTTAAQTYHLFEHAKGKNPDHSHDDDEWWACGRVTR